MATYRGFEAPAAYTDEAREYTVLVRGCGLVDRPWMTRIEMLGEDRRRFLQGLLTCDVQGLEPGDGAYGFVTNVKGRVMADVVVLALEDRLWLVLPAAAGEEISEHLRKYVIVDRVEISVSDDVPLTLIGPRSEESLAWAGELPERVFGHRSVSMAGADLRLVREPPLETARAQAPRWTLWLPVDHAEAIVEQLLQDGSARGLAPVGARALDRLRVEAGQPLFGVDFGRDNFPQETGLEEQAVSYSKGCYLGQEVVARIHYRGGVNRHLRGLTFADRAPDDLLGRPVLAGGREAGRVTSAATVEDGSRIGLSILHRRAAPGEEVEIEGAGPARVVELPFGR